MKGSIMLRDCRRAMICLFCFILAIGCSSSNETELARAKAEAEAARAELERIKSSQPPAKIETPPPAQPTPASPSANSLNEPWANQWKVLANDSKHGFREGEIGPKEGNRPHFEGAGKRTGLLVLHPVSGTEPAKIAFTGTVPSNQPVLVVQAGGSIHGDHILRCVVNGTPVGEYQLDGKQWKNCEFDLSGFTDKPVNLELWNVPGGSKPWYFETCYIDRIDFQNSVTAPVKTASPAAPSKNAPPASPPPGPLVFEHSLIKPGARKLMTFVNGQYGSQPKLEPGVGLGLAGGHTAPAIWASQYLGNRSRAEVEIKLDNEHGWATCVLNGRGYGNSPDAGYGCKLWRTGVAILREGETRESLNKEFEVDRWYRIQADIEEGNIEMRIDGVPVVAFEDLDPLAGPLNGWFGIVGHGVKLRNLKVWSPEKETDRKPQFVPPKTEPLAQNGKLAYELKLGKEKLGPDWNQTQPTAVNIRDGALLLQEGNGSPDIVLSKPLSPELACEVEFEYPDQEAVNFSVSLLYAEKPPETLEQISSSFAWRVQLPTGNGISTILWQKPTDPGEGVWKNTPVLAQTPNYSPLPGRKYLVRLETHGEELRVFLDGGLMLSAKRPEAPPASKVFLNIRQIYGGSRVHAVRVFQIDG